MDGEWREAVERWLRGLEEQGTALHRGHDHLVERLARLERHDRVRTVTDWVAAAHLQTEPLVTVIVPTRDRPAYLRRALGSLVSQRYERWEAVVVDDGGADPAPVLDAVGDERLRMVRTSGGTGACAARNAGLDAANGELIAYLDDDNEMAPLWLKGVVWAFEQRPDVAALYGGIVTADAPGSTPWDVPSLWIRDFDAQRLTSHNLADSSAIAHRAGAPGARWEVSLRQLGDWAMLVSLAAHGPPLALPVVACWYHRDAPDRLMDGARSPAEEAMVAAAARAALG